MCFLILSFDILDVIGWLRRTADPGLIKPYVLAGLHLHSITFLYFQGMDV